MDLNSDLPSSSTNIDTGQSESTKDSEEEVCDESDSIIKSSDNISMGQKDRNIVISHSDQSEGNISDRCDSIESDGKCKSSPKKQKSNKNRKLSVGKMPEKQIIVNGAESLETSTAGVSIATDNSDKNLAKKEKRRRERQKRKNKKKDRAQSLTEDSEEKENSLQKLESSETDISEKDEIIKVNDKNEAKSQKKDKNGKKRKNSDSRPPNFKKENKSQKTVKNDQMCNDVNENCVSMEKCDQTISDYSKKEIRSTSSESELLRSDSQNSSIEDSSYDFGSKQKKNSCDNQGDLTEQKITKSPSKNKKKKKVRNMQSMDEADDSEPLDVTLNICGTPTRVSMEKDSLTTEEQNTETDLLKVASKTKEETPSEDLFATTDKETSELNSLPNYAEGQHEDKAKIDEVSKSHSDETSDKRPDEPLKDSLPGDQTSESSESVSVKTQSSESPAHSQDASSAVQEPVQSPAQADKTDDQESLQSLAQDDASSAVQESIQSPAQDTSPAVQESVQSSQDTTAAVQESPAQDETPAVQSSTQSTAGNHKEHSTLESPEHAIPSETLPQEELTQFDQESSNSLQLKPSSNETTESSPQKDLTEESVTIDSSSEHQSLSADEPSSSSIDAIQKDSRSEVIPELKPEDFQSGNQPLEHQPLSTEAASSSIESGSQPQDESLFSPTEEDKSQDTAKSASKLVSEQFKDEEKSCVITNELLIQDKDDSTLIQDSASFFLNTEESTHTSETLLDAAAKDADVPKDAADAIVPEDKANSTTIKELLSEIKDVLSEFPGSVTQDTSSNLSKVDASAEVVLEGNTEAEPTEITTSLDIESDVKIVLSNLVDSVPDLDTTKAAPKSPTNQLVPDHVDLSEFENSSLESIESEDLPEPKLPTNDSIHSVPLIASELRDELVKLEHENFNNIANLEKDVNLLNNDERNYKSDVKIVDKLSANSGDLNLDLDVNKDNKLVISDDLSKSEDKKQLDDISPGGGDSGIVTHGDDVVDGSTGVKLNQVDSAGDSSVKVDVTKGNSQVTMETHDVGVETKEYEDKIQMRDELERLREELTSTKDALQKSQSHLYRHQIHTNLTVSTLKAQLHKKDLEMKNKQVGHDQQIQAIISRLFLLEGQLRSEQKQILSLLDLKETVIDKQSLKIEDLMSRNDKLAMALKLHNIGTNGLVQSLNRSTSDLSPTSNKNLKDKDNKEAPKNIKLRWGTMRDKLRRHKSSFELHHPDRLETLEEGTFRYGSQENLSNLKRINDRKERCRSIAEYPQSLRNSPLVELPNENEFQKSDSAEAISINDEISTTSSDDNSIISEQSSVGICDSNNSTPNIKHDTRGSSQNIYKDSKTLSVGKPVKQPSPTPHHTSESNPFKSIKTILKRRGSKLRSKKNVTSSPQP